LARHYSIINLNNYSNMVKEITVYGFDFEIGYDIIKGEPEQRYDINGDPGHPGTPDSVKIWSISHLGVDITELYDLFDSNVQLNIEEALK